VRVFPVKAQTSVGYFQVYGRDHKEFCNYHEHYSRELKNIQGKKEKNDGR
jgi:hypothetical protein